MSNPDEKRIGFTRMDATGGYLLYYTGKVRDRPLSACWSRNPEETALYPPDAALIVERFLKLCGYWGVLRVEEERG